ncbi:isoprenoid biosynthesis protein with amidotransferase-like domain [Magnetospirillum gryphiswaldense MSR-1 v2]|uniref:Isoprenoid biosynthesis protein with amidotransferase-like domain n=1 Tax=Magnetospirillum gryphiswaldense (strain DSM 6361 / JCM 21280 / NBRC 15271 / MSR-1) TaxID=431944 RepID=V6F4L2_MAGGM|nr:isoprenoid biosynthesis glyoxalase ElbB [Magnetospirillum gryphiswaldense]CDL00307.1 isoprenoid biosynthesis protein with amidotransferase-like domain [Magnetospirillum gryphiswaldense MSR-1 v2]
MAKAKFAVILSGCGVYDGAEIHEAVLTLLAIDRAGAAYQCFAPDVAQMHVVNHLTGQPAEESRNVLVEAARIARGHIKPLSDLDMAEHDALILPGGFGAAKNLCTFAIAGPDCTVDPQTERVIKAAHAAGKPIGALCIAPALIAKVLGPVTVTIGSDAGTAQAVEATGASHVTTSHGQTVVDRANKLVSSPCYMLDATISQIDDGAQAVVSDILKMLG